MSRIIEIQHFQKKGDYALVNVLLDDGTEAVVYVGGDCEVYFDHGTVKAFVKKGTALRSINMKVIKSEDNLLEFDNGLIVEGDGDADCCAINYLDFEQLPVGTELLTMTAGEFVDKISLKEDGFTVKDSDGTPKWVQARSNQNGYYSNMTTLVVKYKDVTLRVKELSGDISE